jgi:hypothetical protein
LPRAADAAYRRPRLVDGIRFDWVFIALCCWVIVGMAMDAWAHSHGRTDETFFTPWHAGLYTGFIAAVMFISVTLVVNWQRGYRGWELLPPGYALTMVGLLLFGLGGIGDMIWHELFGIEEDLEAIVSPTHLSLAIALGLTVTGPIRAAWQRAERTPASPFPLLLALSFTWSAFSFLTVYAHPFVFLHALRGAEGAQQLGMAGLLLQSVILSGIVLLTVRRWQMPPGSFLLIYTLNALVLTAISDAYLLVISMMAAGFAVDLMNHFWRPRENRHWRLRLFAFLTPASVYLGYFAVFLITGELAWVIHLWAGGIVLAGIVGWVGSYLIWPPPIPAVADE